MSIMIIAFYKLFYKCYLDVYMYCELMLYGKH